jgi:hypothetical protein
MQKYSGDQWAVPRTLVQGFDIGTYTLGLGIKVQTSLSRTIRDFDKLFWLQDENRLSFEEPLPSGVLVQYVPSEFQHVPEWSKGRRQSIQGVFFGRLAVGHEVELPVAVKPFMTAISAGVHETVLLLHLESEGFPVYKVLGASWTQEQGYAMITAFEPDSRSLDNVNWAKGLDEPLSSHMTNLEAVKQVGRTLGLLHANGVLHRDTQLKNFAVVGDTIRVIDLAQARVVVVDDYCDENALEAGMFRDLSMFMDSLKDAKFLKDATQDEWQSFMDNVVAVAYRAGLYEAGGKLQERFGVDLEAMVGRVVHLFSKY